MHIRSRISAADLQRTRERRAWGSLAVCVGAGLALSAAGLSRSGEMPAPTEPSRTTPAPVMVQAAEPAGGRRQPLPPPSTPEIPEAPLDIPLAVSTSPAPPQETPELPEMDFSELEPIAEAWDILPPVELAPTPKREIAAAQPRRAEAGEAPSTPPAYKSAPAPPYPPALRAGRVEGSVRVRISVDATGHPANVEIIAGSGHGEFDICAKNWILKHWEFTPARRGGNAIAGTVTTSVRFVLH